PRFIVRPCSKACPASIPAWWSVHGRLDRRASMSRMLSAISLSLYLAGTFAFYLADVLIARTSAPDVVSDWAATRSLMMIVGTLAPFGLDLLIVRDPSAARSLLRIAAPQTLVVAAITGCAAWLTGLGSSGW